jgi:hypothetical protein
MKFVRITLMGIGGVALAGLLLVPKAAHALVATLVQVVNTTANPVPNLDTERNARIPYQSSQSFSAFSAGLQHLQAGFTGVPAGYRLVAQNVSATLTMEAAAAAPVGILQASATSLSLTLPGSAGSVNGSVRQGGFCTQILAYYDAGSTPSMLAIADFPSGAFQFATLTGYLENCSITGCPAIQR